jgi:hypothetical protein
MFTLAQGWQKWATSNQPWKDLLEMISWQGFEHEDNMIDFKAMKQQSSSMMRLHPAELSILIRGSKGRRNPSKGQFGSKSCSEA